MVQHCLLFGRLDGPVENSVGCQKAASAYRHSLTVLRKRRYRRHCSLWTDLG